MSQRKIWNIVAAVDRLIRSHDLAQDAIDLAGEEVARRIAGLIEVGLPQESIEEIIISAYGEDDDLSAQVPSPTNPGGGGAGATTYVGAATQTHGIGDE